MDSIPEARILAAVVSLAVRDLSHQPIKENNKPIMTTEARSAAHFLFSDSSDGYLEWLDFDPLAFRDKLFKVMNNTSPDKIAGLNPMDRRFMRQNDQLWRELYAGLDHPVFDDEIESVEVARPVVEKPARRRNRPRAASRNRRKADG